eukprot:1140216-Pelagomonas_calceolata.AAC.2
MKGKIYASQESRVHEGKVGALAMIAVRIVNSNTLHPTGRTTTPAVPVAAAVALLNLHCAPQALQAASLRDCTATRFAHHKHCECSRSGVRKLLMQVAQ